MALNPLKTWDPAPKGWLEDSTTEVNSTEVMDTSTAESEATSKLNNWGLDTADPTDLVEEKTEGIVSNADAPIIGVDLGDLTPISEVVGEIMEGTASDLKPESTDLDLAADDSNDSGDLDEDVLDMTFEVMQLYNLPYDLSRAFELACSAEQEGVSKEVSLPHLVKLLKHRLAALDVESALTDKAIPLEYSADWIVDIHSLDFVYGKCVDSILTYAQTGKVDILKSAIRTLEYHITVMNYD